MPSLISTEIPGNLEQALDRAGPANVLLHYAGRAYQRLGCPTWMPGVLANWKAKFPDGHLTVFFHEMPGKLPRLSRHFLLGKMSARIIRQLAAIADVLVTNTENHVAILRKLSGRDDVHFLPIGSNIEPVANSSQAAGDHRVHHFRPALRAMANPAIVRLVKFVTGRELDV